MTSYLTRNIGWFSILAAIAWIVSLATLFIFFAIGGVFGPINDAVSSIQMLLLVPVALALYQVFRQDNPGLSLALTAIAILAMLTFAVLQSLLVLKLVRFEQTLQAVLILGGVVGVWWLVAGILELNKQAFPSGLAWTSILCGSSLLTTMVGFLLGGQEHALAAVGFLISMIAIPVWGIWLGRLLLSEQIVI